MYDALNVLVNDEGLLYRRGGGAYFIATNSGSSPVGLADVHTSAGQRTLVWDDSGNLRVWNGSAWVTIYSGSGGPKAEPFRVVAIPDGVAILSAFNGEWLSYYGSLKSSAYNTGTVTVSAGSTTVTGVGTSWLANVDAGMFFQAPVGGFSQRRVARVNSDTSLELRTPASGALAGSTYTAGVAGGSSIPPAGQALGSFPLSLASVGSPARLVAGFANRAYFSERGRGGIASAEDYHELPTSETIIGADAIEDTAFLFTTGGVWAISNMAFDPVDAYGNIQHVVQEASKDLILWGDPGIAAREGGFIVPAVDDVYAWAPGNAMAPLTARIRPLYRSYVAAGYRPGVAAVHRSHYFLPILNGNTKVDMLVCRLDRDAAWTRFDGMASSTAYAQRVGASTRQPKLLGLTAQRVTDLSGCFDPTGSNAFDGDNTLVTGDVVTRDFPTGQQPGFVQRARVRYEMEDGGTPDPTVTLAFSSDQDGGTFTDLTERGELGGAAGWATSDGSTYQWALVGKRRERIRFRVRVTGVCSRFVLRSIELLTRPQGKQ